MNPICRAQLRKPLRAVLRAPAMAFALLFLVFCFSSRGSAQSPQIAATPPMGWNSCNHFAQKIDDATVRAQADKGSQELLDRFGYRKLLGRVLALRHQRSLEISRDAAHRRAAASRNLARRKHTAL